MDWWYLKLSNIIKIVVRKWVAVFKDNSKNINPNHLQIADTNNKMSLNREIFCDKNRIGRALVTGASSGIGEEYCWQLATNGHNLVMVSTNAEKLEKLAQQIRQKAAVEVEVIAADLSVKNDLDTVIKRIENTDKPIDLLINNAGFAVAQPFVGGDRQREIYALKVMVEAVLLLTHAAVQSMIERKRGAIINVASIAAFTAMGTYAAAKSWVVTFTQSLATELKEYNIAVSALCPGLVKTNFHSVKGLKNVKYFPGFWCTPRKVVEDSLKGIAQNKIIVVPTMKYKIVYVLLKFAPKSIVRKFAGHSRSSTQY